MPNDQLSDLAVIVNDEPVGVIPNSIEFDEGRGEQSLRPVSIGEGKTEQVYSNNLESNFGANKFAMPSTPENVALALKWKTNRDNNVVQFLGSINGEVFSRTFQKCALTTNYKIAVGDAADIEVEFMGLPPI